MVVVEIGEAAARLDELIDRVLAGEEVVLADGGQASGNPDTPDPPDESG